MATAPTELRIRRAAQRDAEAIAHMHWRSWKVGYRGIVSDAMLDGLSLENYRTLWHDILRQQDDTRRTTVAEIDRAIVGYCSIGPTREPGEGEATGEIWGLYVDPDWFRNGIGAALMEQALRELSSTGYEKVALWVLTDNYRGRAFYEAMGWRAARRTQQLQIGEETRYARLLRHRNDSANRLG